MEIKSQLCGLVSFDKQGFVEAMRQGHKVKYDSWINSEEDLKKYDFDLIIDATGLRVLLPRIESYELRIPCVQYRVEYERPPFEDFYVKILDGMSGYLWYFPLEDGVAHVGAGDLTPRPHEGDRGVLRALRREEAEARGEGGPALPAKVLPALPVREGRRRRARASARSSRSSGRG